MRYGCEQCREEVAVREELSHLERALLAAHLEACTSCRSFATRRAAMIDSARAWPPILTGPRKDAILDAICARCEPARARARPHAALRASAVVLVPAALLLFAVLRMGTDVAGPPRVSRDIAREDSPTLAPPAPPPAAASPRAEVPRPALASQARRGQRTIAPAEPRERGTTARAPSARMAASQAADIAHPFDSGSLYVDAERALSEGRPARAALLLEELIDRAPDAPEAQTARLELGRLYAGALQRPARAVAHLSAFVAREPEPSARMAAKGLLCRVLPAAERRLMCWPGLAALGSN